MSATIPRRRVDVVFGIGTGTDGTGASQTITVQRKRVSCAITMAGGLAMGGLAMQIFGMKLEQMNSLLTLSRLPTFYRRNTVEVLAGDEGGTLASIFKGTIQDAHASFEASPESLLNVQAYTGFFDAINPVPAISFAGAADCATIMQGLAKQMNLAFENGGVSVSLTNPVFNGTAYDQAQQCAQAGGFNFVIEGGTLAIWSKTGTRAGAVVDVSPATGMLGYPAFTSVGIHVKTVFNPAIRYGSRIKVTSSLTQACGDWQVYTLAHDLESEIPDGEWSSYLDAGQTGYLPSYV